MDIRIIEDRLHVSPQIQPQDLREVAALGYRSVICNRPDDEAPDQPTSERIRAAASAAGLAFTHIPVTGDAIGSDDTSRFKTALETLPAPILGYCRSGTRTTTLWALSQAGVRSTDQILALASDGGYDLSALRPRLEG